MRVKDFDYTLPMELIAREPREFIGEKRSDSRMIVMDREKEQIYHKKFVQIIDYIEPGDVLVLNNSKTIKANMIGFYNRNKKIEFNLCGIKTNNVWTCYIQFDSMIAIGGKITIKDGDGIINGVVVEKQDNKIWSIEFDYLDMIEAANRIGRHIVSHYFKKRCDIKYLQNVYSSVDGSSELPAAGRHFDWELLELIRSKGGIITYVTLHTGLSSINVDTENFEDFTMHEEYIELSAETAEILNKAKASGNKIIGTGTTVMRTLESCVDDKGYIFPYKGFTNLFIYEGFQFKVVDKFITNFHAPQSTRIALAAAFSGNDLLKHCYTQAIENKYQFFEFGDATLTI
ncbi:MAG: tRNA preQ1(34) S-adenosylmethionine ribosyltransferase-isomerase QueA [Mobilitalea sp.]